MKQMSDYEVIRQYLQGDEKALEVLVHRYMDSIYKFVFSYVKNSEIAQDITQEVFVKVWRNLKKIQKNKSFKSWIYTVAKNTALDFLKKKKAVPFSSFEDEAGKNMLVEKIRAYGQSPYQYAQGLENQSIFMHAIGTLSEKYKMVLLLYYYEYLNFREIAERLKEPINTIKSRHRRGLVLLEKEISYRTKF